MVLTVWFLVLICELVRHSLSCTSSQTIKTLRLEPRVVRSHPADSDTCPFWELAVSWIL